MRKIKMGFLDVLFICLLLIDVTGAADIPTKFVVLPIMFEMGIGLTEGFIQCFIQNNKQKKE
jgi:hypothetical protein